MFVALLVSVSQTLGSVGLFRRWPVALASLGLLACVAAWHQRSPPCGVDADETDRSVRRAPTWPRRISLGIATIVVAQWANRSVEALGSGIADVDSLAYHLPFAARFLQQGSITDLQVLRGSVSFYPASGSLVHAFAMLPFHRDVFSPMLNLAWLSLALLAAWCVGDRLGVGHLTGAGAAVVLTSPVLATFNAGTAGNDIVVTALVLTTVALLLEGEWRTPAVSLAGAVAGVAISTKLNVLAPVVVFSAVLPLAVPRRRRLRATGAWGVGVVALGSFWYVRNWSTVGNPLPWFGFEPLGMAGIEADGLAEQYGVPLVRYALDLSNRSELVQGMLWGFGWAWPLLVAVAGASLVLAIAHGRPPLHRAVGLLGVLIVAAYAVTPISAGGLPEGFFAVNVRYMIPGLAVGMVLLPILPVMSSPQRQTTLLAVLVAIFVAAQTTAGRWVVWPGGRPWLTVLTLALGACGVVVVARAWGSTGGRRRRGLAALLAAALVVGGWFGQGEHLDRRYRSGNLPPTLDPVDSWAQGVADARIGVAADLVYPLYGSTLSNEVEVVVPADAGATYSQSSSCTEWRRAVDEGGYDFVVVRAGALATGPGPELEWTRTAPAAAAVVTTEATTVFRLLGPLGVEGCPQ